MHLRLPRQLAVAPTQNIMNIAHPARSFACLRRAFAHVHVQHKAMRSAERCLDAHGAGAYAIHPSRCRNGNSFAVFLTRLLHVCRNCSYNAGPCPHCSAGHRRRARWSAERQETGCKKDVETPVLSSKHAPWPLDGAALTGSAQPSPRPAEVPEHRHDAKQHMVGDTEAPGEGRRH